MRNLFAVFVVLIAAMGCVGDQPSKQNFSGEFSLENVTAFEGGYVEDLNTGEADAIFHGMDVERDVVTVVYFGKQGCSACIALGPWIDQVKKKYNNSVVWFEYDISTPEGWNNYLLFKEAYHIPDNESYVPMLFIGGTYGWGIDGIRTYLESRVDYCHENGCQSAFETLRG